MSYSSLFKSPESEASYLVAYQAMLDLWPVQPEAIDIETSFGSIHFQVAGSPSSPPLFLIHGAAVNSTIWYPNIAPLARQFRVYAPDVLNQSGLSVRASKIDKTQDNTKWLVESMDALNIERATFIGHSYGGWISLNFAIRHPQSVDRMVLLSPTPAFAHLNWLLIPRMLLTVLIPTRRMFYSFFQWMTTMPLGDNHVIVEQFMAGMKAFRPETTSLATLSVFSDEELAGVHHPTLLLIGDREVTYKPKIVLERARRLMPCVEAELIADGGHLFPIDQSEATNARMMAFLMQDRLVASDDKRA